MVSDVRRYVESEGGIRRLVSKAACGWGSRVGVVPGVGVAVGVVVVGVAVGVRVGHCEVGNGWEPSFSAGLTRSVRLDWGM